MTTTPTYLTENDAALVLIADGFDDLLLTGENAAGNSWYELSVMAVSTSQQGPDWGSPQPLDISVERWKTDGAIAQTQNHGDRTIAFTIRIRAGSSAALAAGETALALRSAQPCILRWLPPQGEPDAVSTDFEIQTWHLPFAFDLDGEMRLTRKYAVTMTAKPWARSSKLVTVAALTLPGSPTVTPVDTCASTTGWAASPGTLSTSGGAVRSTTTVVATGKPNPHFNARLDRTGSVTGLGTTPILALNMGVTGGTATWYVFADGVQLAKVGQVGATSYWQMPAGVTSLTVLTVLVDIAANKTASIVQLAIADVSKTDTIAGVGSRKQLTRSLDVGGSVKTSGSIKVASPSSTPLGNVLVYTQPDNGLGFNPGLRQYRSSGNTVTVDATTVSGSHETFPAVSPILFTVPGTVLPEASYVVLMRAKCSAIGVMPVILASYVDGYAATRSFTDCSMDFTATNTYQWAVIGGLEAPNQTLPDESTLGSVISIAAASVPGTVTIDEVYLLDITHGDYSLIDCGATATRLWLDPPDAGSTNRPAVYLGTLDDRSDAVGVDAITQLKNLGKHDIDPRGGVMATVTDGVDNAAVSWTGYQRWHTHAAA